MKKDYTIFLNDIVKAIESIEKFIKGISFEEFKSDDKTTSAVIRKLKIMGEASKIFQQNYANNFLKSLGKKWQVCVID